jgi:ammonia channel protein AmtB
VVPLRVPEEDEINGLDVALHGEVAYNFGGSGSSAGVMAFVEKG